APASRTATAVGYGSEDDRACADNATNEEGLRIEYCAGVGCTAFGEIAVVGTNVTTYQHFSPASGTSHSYRVRAYTTTGTSVYSNTAVAVIPLPAPATLTATAVSGTRSEERRVGQGSRGARGRAGRRGEEGGQEFAVDATDGR